MTQKELNNLAEKHSISPECIEKVFELSKKQIEEHQRTVLVGYIRQLSADGRKQLFKMLKECKKGLPKQQWEECLWDSYLTLMDNN